MPETQPLLCNLKEWKPFQRSYLIVYAIVMGADWLQGPYLFKLYESYGLDLSDIARLFLTGFMSSAVASIFIGSIADACGRRRMCLVFCLTTVTYLCMRRTQSYPVLFISHMLSGTSTAMLFGVFESWYVSEHISKDFPNDTMTSTFATATLFNGLAAILAGLLANKLVQLWGYQAPNAAATVLLIVAAGLIACIWSENHGDTTRGIRQALSEAWVILFGDRAILILCGAQTCFECAMYIFVLLYTPAIEATQDSEIQLGYLFSVMMLAIMLGSGFFRLLLTHWRVSPGWLLSLSLGLAGASFWSMRYTTGWLLAVTFILFEFSTGIYFPSISSLKAATIPEDARAAVMTILRIPMNIGVGIVLWQVNQYSIPAFFGLCGIMCLIGSIVIAVSLQKNILHAAS